MKQDLLQTDSGGSQTSRLIAFETPGFYWPLTCIKFDWPSASHTTPFEELLSQSHTATLSSNTT